MSLTKAVAAPQYSLLRGSGYGGNMLVSLFSNRVVYAGQVNSNLTGSGSWAQFNTTNITVGAYTAAKENMCLLIGHVNDISKFLFYGRLRFDASSSFIQCNESSIDFNVGDYFWVIDSHMPQYRLSRPSTLDPNTAVELVDFDESYANPAPWIVGLKTGYAGYIDPNTGYLRLGFDISRSYAVRSGGSTSNPQFAFPAGTLLLAGSLSSNICIVDIPVGEAWGKVTLQDGAQLTTRYFGLKVHDTGSNQPDVGFEGGTIEADISRGWTCSLPAFEGVDSVLPNTCAIVWRANEQYSGASGSLYGGGSASVTNKALTSNVATLTAAGHPFAVGQEVIVAIGDSVFDGTFIITGTTSNTFSYAKVHANVASAAASGMAVVNPDNVLFVGWLQTESDNVAGDMNYAVTSGATFNFTGVGPRLNRIVAQLLAFLLNASPTLWGQIVNLTVWRGLAHFFYRYTTLEYLCDLTFDSIDDTFLFPTVTTQGGNFFSAPSEIAKQINALLEFGLAGQIAVNREVAYLDQTARNALPQIASWTSADGFVVNRQSDPMPNIGRADGDGLFYNNFSGGLPTGYTVRAPGFAQGEAPGTNTLSNQILAATSNPAAALAELKQRIGNKFEFDNLSEFLDFEHPAGYIGVGFIPSRSEIYLFTLDTTLAGPNGVNRIIYDTSVLWTIDSVRLSYNVQLGDWTVRNRYRRVSRIGDPGDNTTKVDPGTIAPALPDLGLPAFDFQLPEFTFPDAGLNLDQINPLQLLPPPGKVATFVGQELAIKSPTKAFYLKNFIALKVPQARDVTPPDLGSFQIQQILIDPFFTDQAIPAYILASDGTNSAIWYCPNIVSSAPLWTKGAAFPGLYTVLRATGTAGTVLAYNPSNTTYWSMSWDFSTGNAHGWTAILGPDGNPLGTINSDGWHEGCSHVVSVGTYLTWIFIALQIPSNTTLTGIQFNYDNEVTQNDGPTVENMLDMHSTDITDPDANIIYQVPIPPLGPFAWRFNGSYPILANRYVAGVMKGGNLASGCPAGTLRSTYAAMEGIGSNPFGGGAGDSQRVVVSTNYGASVAVPLGFGSAPVTVGGFDVQKAGGVSYGGASGKIYKATTLGGSYSDWFTVPGSPDVVCLVIPYFKRNSTTLKNTTTSTPDVIAACSNGKLYWIDGATASATDITPPGMTQFDNPNCVTVSYGINLAVFGKVGGTYHLFTSTDGGATWTDRTSLTSPHFIRDRRNDTRAKQGSNHGQLYLAVDGFIDYSSIWDGAGMSPRTMPTSGIDGFDTIF